MSGEQLENVVSMNNVWRWTGNCSFYEQWIQSTMSGTEPWKIEFLWTMSGNELKNKISMNNVQKMNWIIWTMPWNEMENEVLMNYAKKWTEKLSNYNRTYWTMSNKLKMKF